MVSPDRREITLIILAFVWFFVITPPLLLLSIRLGLSPTMRVWIGWAVFLIFALLGGTAVFLYTRRVAREMGAPGLVVAVIWIGLAILLARGLLSALRSIGH
jgi:hypothetical protein